VACFEEEEYEMAKSAFEEGARRRQALGKDCTIYSRWLRKCDVELSGKREREREREM